MGTSGVLLNSFKQYFLLEKFSVFVDELLKKLADHGIETNLNNTEKKYFFIDKKIISNCITNDE